MARNNLYVTTSKKILDIKGITFAEKLILGRAAGFKQYYETAQSCADFFGMSKETVLKARRHLQGLGLLIEIGNNGRGKIYDVPNEYRTKKFKTEEVFEEPTATPTVEYATEYVDSPAEEQKYQPDLSREAMIKAGVRPSLPEPREQRKQKFEKAYADYLKAYDAGLSYLRQEQIPIVNKLGLQHDFMAIVNVLLQAGYNKDDTNKIILRYFEYLNSDAYVYQCQHNQFCPRIRTQQDLYQKFNKIRDFKHSPERQYDPSKTLTRN